MDLNGTVYFDFESVDSWRLLQLLMAAETEGMRIDVTWSGFAAVLPGDDEPLSPSLRALAAHAAVFDTARQRIVRHALFTMRHGQGDSLGDDLTYRAAARVAGMDEEVLLAAIPDVGLRALRETSDAGRRVGVVAVPSIVRHGTPLHVATTAAILDGPPRPRVTVIDQVMGDDGLWRLEKP